MATKVLVVEDNENQQETWRNRISSISSFGSTIALLSTYSIEEAEEMFRSNKSDITAIVMDGCVPGNYLNTKPLVQKFRDEGFDGPMIAVSSIQWYRDQLVTAGCSHQASKDDLPRKLLEVLGMK